MNSFRSFLPIAAAAWCGCTASTFAQSSPYSGLWVGDVTLGAVNEVSVPLDQNNVPRAPDPKVTTPTADTASLRLIIHVDGTGRARLLKHVAILARKEGKQETESDLALVTNERLYGAFPAQPAIRISSATFDFGDAKSTAAVDKIVSTASAAAATAAAASNATVDSVKAAVLAAINPLIVPADATARFSTFLQTEMSADKIRALATTGSPPAAMTNAANALRDGSFYQDTRGIEMIQAIITAVNSATTATAAQKEQLALNIAASYSETVDGYERFLAGEIFGDMITAASKAAADATALLPLKQSTSFASADNGAAVIVQSPAHGLANSEEIAIQGAPVAAYNGLHTILRINDDSFKISTPYIAGGTVGGYSGSTNIAPLVVVSPGHGLSGETRITIRSSQNGYNGSHIATPLGADSFSIPLVFNGDPSVRGSWATRGGSITAYTATSSGTSGIKITAPLHGLNNGQSIEIYNSATPSYNGRKTITRIDENSFSINQAFVDNPAIKGSWDIPLGITQYSPPTLTPTRVTATAHGLKSGDKVVISGAGFAGYNATHPIKVIDANSFSIPVVFVPASGNPATKGTWKVDGGASWRRVEAIRTAINNQPKVAAAQTEASRIRVAAYNDTRAADAVRIVTDAILLSAATNESVLTEQVNADAAKAARQASASSVPRYAAPAAAPSEDYDSFVRSPAFSGAAATAAQAAAATAIAEKSNIISTPASIADKAKANVITALSAVYSEASRTLLPELPMQGTFATGSSDLTVQVDLPANHPTNPFRHRRHPDHTTGFDIKRIIKLNFASAEADGLTRAGYGVDRIVGVYDEEIFGLHKPLGPNKDTGLKVQGLFKLHRISLIDTLNGK